MKNIKLFNETLSKARYHLEIGDYEIAENFLNEANMILLKIDNNESHMFFLQCKVDLFKRTGRREKNILLWDEMEQYCVKHIHRCIRFSGKALDYLMMKNDEEALNNAEAALKESENLDENNRILAFQVLGEVYKRKKNWEDAIKMYSAIAAIAEKSNNKSFIALYHAKIAVMLKQMGYINIAIDRLFEAEDHARELKNIDIMQKIAIWRADIYREIGEDKKALDLLRKLAILNDEYI